jgi:hypothetical protein
MKLGYASPARMLQDMRPSELGTWIALYAVDPWGEQRADLRTGILASTMANIHRGKGSQAFSPADFMPRYEASARKDEGNDVAARLLAFLKNRPTRK